MSTRLVLDEFDVNLPPLTSGLVVIVVVVVGGGGTDARTLNSSGVSTISVAGRVFMTAGGSIGIRNVGHV